MNRSRLTAPDKDTTASLPGVRSVCAGLGVVALGVLGFLGDGDQANRLAQLAFAALGLATITGWWQLSRSSRTPQLSAPPEENRGSRAWLSVGAAVTLVTGVGVQMWFKPGTTIASGDITPPVGTAWLGRLFEPWAWTGSNLGEPSQLPLLAPWATVLDIVHMFGGGPELAQRIWYTALFVGAALGALAFLAALRLGPLAALVGATAYVLNPYVVSYINLYPNYMAALGLLAALPAVLIQVGAGRLSARWGAVLIAASGPLLGYTFLNPPLVGLIVGAILATPLLVAWLDGKKAAARSARALLLAIPLLLATSAYWIVAATLHLVGAGETQLASLANWAFTEARANLRNAFWLNSMWAWTYPEYFPYAPSYDSFPLSFARFAVPAIAFVPLGLRQAGNGTHKRSRLLRIAVAAATVALLIIFLSTGTNPPGNLLFDRLYSLPFGWLIREPNRFLMVAALAYATLVAVAIEALVNVRSVVDFIRFRLRSTGVFTVLYPTVAVGASLLVGFPLLTGAIVVDQRPKLPPTHVSVPDYWAAMAQFVDRFPMQGSVLVMPPDDFYQMPYTWGYYGNDDFVVELFQRPVLLPNPQGYVPTSPEVISAVDLTAQSILNHNWRQVEALTTALHTPLVLVRGDIQSSYSGRSILAPNNLVDALNSAPNFELVHQIGSLDLFALKSTLREPEISSAFMTIDSVTPDLRLLSLLPPGTQIISSRSLVGVPRIDKAPPIEQWQIDGDSLAWRPTSPPGSTYQIADLDTMTVTSLDRAGTFTVGNGAARVVYAPDGAIETVTAYVRVSDVPVLPNLVLIATPDSSPATPLRLVTLHGSYSNQWGSTDGRHVEVDGMLNGWLMNSGSDPFTASYLPSTTVMASQRISVVSWSIAMLIVIWLLVRRPFSSQVIAPLARRYRSRHGNKES